MCGIAGMVGPSAGLEVVRAMTEALGHRGPDGLALHQDGEAVLGHTRLAIIDLQDGGQPMGTADGAVWIVHNGEIYNYRELRAELEGKGHAFRTRSDTEVILEGYRAWGPDVLARLDGMFALALWDAPRRRLLLARDPLGIKPLHYAFDGRTLRFASEAKALLRDPRVPRALDFQAAHWLLNLRYVPGERTLVAGIRRLPAGQALAFEAGRLALRAYDDLRPRPDGRHPEDHYLEGIRHHLGAAVRKQLVADVPLGVYLSGGLDSSAVVALASPLADGPLQTFSLGFGHPTDELPDARVVAERFGTRHREATLDPDPLRDLPAAVWAAEEPKVNSIQGLALARLARPHVKAVLSGLGGDELFAGYTIHRFLYPTDRLHRATPGWARAPLDAASRAVGRIRLPWLDEYVRGVQFLLSAGAPVQGYLLLRNAWDHDPGAFALYGPAWADQPVAPTSTVFAPYLAAAGPHVLDRVLWAELRTKLVDDFLLNEDRMAMAAGLEVRVPFLDRDLVRFALAIPPGLKMRGNRAKALFRKALAPLLPAHTLRKRKQGFAFDAHHQFRRDLRTTAERVLTRARVEARGWFDYRFLRRILDHPPHPRMRRQYFLLWLVLGLEVWARMFLDRPGDRPAPELSLDAYG